MYYKEKRIIIAIVIFMSFIATFLFLPGLIQAFDLVPPPVTSDPPDAPVEKTGQTVSYATGDDGDLQKGVAWPIPRFFGYKQGIVKDNLTGLIWMKNANCFETKTWEYALMDCNTLAHGQCGLKDGSQPGDWRLANRKELESLLHLFIIIKVSHLVT
jgi:hypothetical protein